MALIPRGAALPGTAAIGGKAGPNLSATDVGNLRLAMMGVLPNLAGPVLAFGVALRARRRSAAGC